MKCERHNGASEWMYDKNVERIPVWILRKVVNKIAG